MKKMISLLLAMLVMISVFPATALADDYWICSDCHIWVSGDYCPQCIKERPTAGAATNECLVTFQINFEKNTIFSKYDVEIVINGETAFTMNHGESLDGTIVMPKGMCEVVFRYKHDHTADLRFTLNLTQDTTFTADMSTHFYGIVLENITCPAFLGNQMLYTGDSGTRNGARLTLRGLTTSRGTGICAPAEGYVFVMVEFEVLNTQSRSLTLNTDKDFRCYCDGYIIEPSIRASAVAPMGFADHLGGGDKTKGMICFELPQNWRELKIIYGNVEYAYDRLVFVINNN